jgi:predicted ester cyclase
MSLEENKALVRRFLEEQARGNLGVIDELLHPDFVDRSLLPGQGPSREDFKRSAAEILASFSVVSFAIETQIAEGDLVATRYTERSIKRSEYMGVAPTGVEEDWTAIYIHRIAGGKIVEEWSEASTLVATLQRLEQETRQRARVEQELQVARRIQHALLPKDLPELEGWQIAYHYQPAREVGKGIPAALVMANTQSVLRTVAQRGSAPGQALAEANEVLYAYMPPNTFVTCFYGVLDPKSGRLVYANAGHDLPCERHDGGVEELRARGMPLGLMTDMSYEEKETTLVPGDSILFYSDGLIEAHNSEREMFGSHRLRTLMAEHPTGEKSLTTLLLEELERFTGEEREQEDDITLITLRCSTIQARS